VTLIDQSPERGATISEDGLYRYCLWRQWGGGPSMTFVMLNPSTADAEKDDPTIRRCIGFAKREGCGRLEVVNLFALRATTPRKLLDHPNPEGSGLANWHHVVRSCQYSLIAVAAWGGSCPTAGGVPILSFTRDNLPSRALRCLGHTKSGEPRHPLYVKAETPLVEYRQELRAHQ
jgi:hypothetical protein